MGLLDEEWKPNWYQKNPLRPPTDFELWLDLRGRPELGRAGQVDCREEVEALVRGLLKELGKAGPAIKQCSPGNPVQGLLFDERAYPTEQLGSLPHLITRMDQAIMDEELHVVGRDLTISAPPLQLAEAEEHFGTSKWLLIDDVLTGGREVLKPMLIDEMVAQCAVGRGAVDTRVLVSADNVMDANEAVMVYQYGKEWLRSIGGDREHIEEMLIKGFITEEEWNELEADGLIPPIITPYLDRKDKQLGTWRREAAEQVLQQQTQDGAARLDELAAKEEAERRQKSPWVQAELFDLGDLREASEQDRTASEHQQREQLGLETAGGPGPHVLALPVDAELWAVALALRSRELWIARPDEQFSIAFPGGVPEELMEMGREAVERLQEKFEKWMRLGGA